MSQFSPADPLSFNDYLEEELAQVDKAAEENDCEESPASFLPECILIVKIWEKDKQVEVRWNHEFVEEGKAVLKGAALDWLADKNEYLKEVAD